VPSPDDADGSGDAGRIAAGSWAETLRLARARALAAGVTVHWDRIQLSEEERVATERLRESLPAPDTD
jgi:hypothetical protein